MSNAEGFLTSAVRYSLFDILHFAGLDGQASGPGYKQLGIHACAALSAHTYGIFGGATVFCPGVPGGIFPWKLDCSRCVSVCTKRSLPFSRRKRCESGAPLPPVGLPAPKVQNTTTEPMVSSTTKRRLAMFTQAGTPTSQLSLSVPLPVYAPPSVRWQGYPQGTKSFFPSRNASR
jgi:hypothetical protein